MEIKCDDMSLKISWGGGVCVCVTGLQGHPASTQSVQGLPDLHKIFSLKRGCGWENGTGEMTWQLRALVVFPKD